MCGLLNSSERLKGTTEGRAMVRMHIQGLLG